MANSARARMIAAAERLAAERGLGATSLREVQLAADQRNKSAAHYHFGSREGLIEAVLVARMGPINERRVELLLALDARGDGADRRGLLEAFVRPIVEHTIARPGSHWARFLLQCAADPLVADIVARSAEGHGYRDVVNRLAAGLDHLPPALRTSRLEYMQGLVFTSLAATEHSLGTRRTPRLPVEAQLNDLVDLCLAILERPPSAETLASIPARLLTAR
jgi:AcrR family transcriptional regulator